MFYETLERNKKWRVDAVIDEVAKKMFLANRTVEAIIKYEGIYGNTPPTQSNQLQLL